MAPVAAQQAVPELPFESVPNPLTMPNDIHFGEIGGVAMNSKRHIFVFSRGNLTGPAYMNQAAQLLEFDATGKYVREIGKNNFAMSYAHAVRIDKQDNIWIVDKGSNMIVKFNPQGRVEWVFGRKGESSHLDVPPDFASQMGQLLKRAGLPVELPANNNPRNPVPVHRDNTFNQPTDVAWDSKGNSYFSDGYINSRVAKVNARGEWIASWGSLGNGRIYKVSLEGKVLGVYGQPGRNLGEFGWIHAIACPSEDEIWVGELINWRVQKLVTKGKGRATAARK
jgi:hypothetical protein